MTWRADGPQGNEAAKVRWAIVPYTRGKGLDVGCGPSKAFAHFTGVDNLADVKLFGITMQPDVVVDDACVLPFAAGSQDFVFSSHLLEHIPDPVAALREWWRVLREGGHLILYLPHRYLYPNVGQPGANPDHKHDFVPRDIYQTMQAWIATDYCRVGFELVVNEERSAGDEYSFLQVYRKDASWPIRRVANGKRIEHGAPLPILPERPALSACVVRYGGFGDQLQAANILPELKRQGYHVTFMTTPKGRNILAHDPHVDAWIIQDTDQVPNEALADYWRDWSARFDRFINLSESVECALLAVPGRANHQWPDAVRRKYLGLNYLEWTAELAELPYRSEARFYPSREERDAVRGMLAHYGGREAWHVVWALSGSSIHKFYPWQDVVIGAAVEEFENIHLYLVGDSACKILEAGLEDHPQITCLSGDLDIRGTLTLAKAADCVVGPETGVLNAVAFEDAVGKVVMLSHSSVENLTKHWRNALALVPTNTPCYPCHRMHYGRDWCSEHPESGAALCQANIEPERVLGALRVQHGRWLAGRQCSAAVADGAAA